MILKHLHELYKAKWPRISPLDPSCHKSLKRFVLFVRKSTPPPGITPADVRYLDSLYQDPPETVTVTRFQSLTKDTQSLETVSSEGGTLYAAYLAEANDRFGLDVETNTKIEHEEVTYDRTNN